MPRRVKSVEGARGIAALGVLVHHVAVYVPGAGPLEHTAISYFWLGVPLFFLLSGLLLFQPFARAIIRESPSPQLSRYFRSRFLRIFPAYWVVLTVAIIQRPHLATSTWTVVANYTLLFLPFHMLGILPVAWTLCIEISFYAALPVFAWGLIRLIGKTDASSAVQRGVLIVAVLSLSFPISYFYLGQAGPGSDQLPVSLPGYLDEFAIGMILAVALELRPHVSAWTSRALLAGGLAVLLFGHKVYATGTGAPFSSNAGVLFPRVMEIGFALILASVLMRDERTTVGRFLGLRAVVVLGTVSYGIYLWHIVVIRELDAATFWTTEWAALLATLAAAIALAALSWILIERPSLALKNRSLRESFWPSDARTAALVGDSGDPNSRARLFYLRASSPAGRLAGGQRDGRPPRWHP